jgi:hypothetical protein
MVIKNKSANDHTLYFTIISVFVLAFFGSFLLYVTAMRESYLDWRRRIAYFPLFMAGSMGLSANNTRAILQGLFNHRSEFLRTPKFRLESAQDRFVDKQYFKTRQFWCRDLRNAMIEALLFFYSLAGIGMAIFYGELAAIPFQAMYCLGYGFIAYLSFRQYLWPRLAETLFDKTGYEEFHSPAAPAGITGR